MSLSFDKARLGQRHSKIPLGLLQLKKQTFGWYLSPQKNLRSWLSSVPCKARFRISHLCPLTKFRVRLVSVLCKASFLFVPVLLTRKFFFCLRASHTKSSARTHDFSFILAKRAFGSSLSFETGMSSNTCWP